MIIKLALKTFLVMLILSACSKSPTGENFVGSWFGGSGDHTIHFYRLEIRFKKSSVVPNVRDLDALRNPVNALDAVMNTLEHYAVQGADVRGAVSMSLKWAGLDQEAIESVGEAYYLPHENMVIGQGLPPIQYDKNTDTLSMGGFYPCFSRSMELANSDGC